MKIFRQRSLGRTISLIIGLVTIASVLIISGIFAYQNFRAQQSRSGAYLSDQKMDRLPK